MPGDTQVMVAVLLLGARTFGDIQRVTGLKSRGDVSRRLGHLRAAGLVASEPGQQGTLRPLVEVVAVYP